MAHHDAARSGAVFDPAIPAALARRFPRLLERANTSPPLLWAVFGGPALVALGAALGRPGPARAGTALSFAACAVLAEIGSRATVPGANDNLSGVATLLALARRLAAAAGGGPARRPGLLGLGGVQQRGVPGMGAPPLRRPAARGDATCSAWTPWARPVSRSPSPRGCSSPTPTTGR